MGLFGKLRKGNKEAKEKQKKEARFKVSGIELDNAFKNTGINSNVLEQMERMGFNPFI